MSGSTASPSTRTVARGRVGLFAGLWGDIRSAVRQLRVDPRVHLGAALVLAAGLGSATWSWGVEYGAFGRGLPVSEPDRMMALQMIEVETRQLRNDFSVADLDVLADVTGIDAIGLWGWSAVNFRDDVGPPARVEALRVTPSMFGLLEAVPLHGRLLLPSDAEAGSAPVAVLGHRFWTRRYHADPGVVGRTVDIDGRSAVIVGILPPDAYIQTEAVWLPIRGAAQGRRARSYLTLLRRSARITPGALAASLRGLGRRLPPAAAGAEQQVELRAVPFTELFRDGPGVLWVIRWAGALLFVMALANVANLYLVRARVRARELAVRRALGASRAHILRKLVVEAAPSVLLAAVGAALLARAALAWYQAAGDAYAGGRTPAWVRYALELPHIGVVAGGALAALLVVGMVAGVAAAPGEGSALLRSGRGVGARRFRLGRGLVGLEVAVGTGLLVLASLMIRSAWNLRTVDWGFARASVMTGHVTLDGPRYATPEARLRFWTALESELVTAPGVRAATLATQLPMIRYAGEWSAVRRVEVERAEPRDPDALPRHYVDAVTPTFFETFETPVVRGRGITAADDGGSAPVALVNTHFTNAYFPGDSPIGKRVRMWRGDVPGPWRTIIGVAPHLWMDTDVNRQPEGVYVPLAQAAPREASMAVRVDGDPSSYAGTLREAVRRLDPELPVVAVRTMPELIRDRTRLYRRQGPPFIWIGLAALIITLAGLYAVVSYIASLRIREFGIRTAVGAPRSDLVLRALRAEAPAVLAGLVPGTALGLWLTRSFSRYIFRVDPWSPGVLAATLAVLLLVSVTATLVPVTRSSRLDVMRVLNSE